MQSRFTDGYSKEYLQAGMMGPNAMRIMEELASSLPLKPGMRVLDLGCGMGLTSVLLAEQYGASVTAADLWIAPADNAVRFAERGLDGSIIPLRLDATQDIPFAENYFDMIVSVDAYQYFGDNREMLPKLLPYVKQGGYIGVAVPGFTEDFTESTLPAEIRPLWTPEWHFYSKRWWRELWSAAEGISITECRDMECEEQAWDEWLESPSPFAENDRKMMAAGAGEYFALIQLCAQKD